MYILIDEHTIMPYNNEVLKRFVGNRLVKAISNPTQGQLQEFGYMELADDAEPDYDAKTQYLTFTYAVEDGQIHKVYAVQAIETEEPIDQNLGVHVGNPAVVMDGIG